MSTAATEDGDHEMIPVAIKLKPESEMPSINSNAIVQYTPPEKKEDEDLAVELRRNVDDVPFRDANASGSPNGSGSGSGSGSGDFHQIMEHNNPGPTDPTVLYLQSVHRSQLVWENEYIDTLHCRRREAVISRTMQSDPRIEPLLRQSGFYGVSRIQFIQLDWHLVTALVERWRQETHTFHMPYGECTITLQDVAVQFGLPIDGEPVIGPLTYNWVNVCTRLLGVTPGPAQLKGSRLSMPWLSTQFTHLPNYADEEAIRRYARAYILFLIGGMILTDKSNSLVHLMYLPLLEDFEAAGKLSWGGACLAWMYRELCKASSINSVDIAGPLVLLQLWAWDRFPTIAPRRLHLHDQNLADRPLGARWNDTLCTTETSTHVLVQYRYMLDRLTPDQINWEPYKSVLPHLPDYCLNGHEIWMSRCPLICFFAVEWHHPDRVMRQFGLIQRVPEICNTDIRLHSYDMRGRHEHNWILQLSVYLEQWAARRANVIKGHPISDCTDVEDGYMTWYNLITRRYITKVGASFDYLINAFPRILSLVDSPKVKEICDIAVGCLHNITSMYRVRHPNKGSNGQRKTRRSNRDYAFVDREPTNEDESQRKSSTHPFDCPTPLSIVPTSGDVDQFSRGTPLSGKERRGESRLYESRSAVRLGDKPSRSRGRGERGQYMRARGRGDCGQYVPTQHQSSKGR